MKKVVDIQTRLESQNVAGEKLVKVEVGDERIREGKGGFSTRKEFHSDKQLHEFLTGKPLVVTWQDRIGVIRTKEIGVQDYLTNLSKAGEEPILLKALEEVWRFHTENPSMRLLRTVLPHRSLWSINPRGYKN